MRIQAAGRRERRQRGASSAIRPQAGGVPCLAEAGALARLRALAKQAAQRASADLQLRASADRRRHVRRLLPGSTMRTARRKPRRVMNTLAALAARARCSRITHRSLRQGYRKGVRGSLRRAPPANDAILACLGDRDQASGCDEQPENGRDQTTGRARPASCSFDLESNGTDGFTCVVRWRLPPKSNRPQRKASGGRRR